MNGFCISLHGGVSSDYLNGIGDGISEGFRDLRTDDRRHDGISGRKLHKHCKALASFVFEI